MACLSVFLHIYISISLDLYISTSTSLHLQYLPCLLAGMNLPDTVVEQEFQKIEDSPKGRISQFKRDNINVLNPITYENMYHRPTGSASWRNRNSNSNSNNNNINNSNSSSSSNNNNKDSGRAKIIQKVFSTGAKALAAVLQSTLWL